MKAFPSFFLLSEILRALNSDMTFSQVAASSHVASALFPSFGIPGRCTFTLTLERREGRTERREETRKVSRDISHIAVASNFIVIQMYYKRNVSATLHIFRTNFNDTFIRRIMSFFTSTVRRYAEFRHHGQQRNTVKETAVEIREGQDAPFIPTALPFPPFAARKFWRLFRQPDGSSSLLMLPNAERRKERRRT